MKLRRDNHTKQAVGTCAVVGANWRAGVDETRPPEGNGAAVEHGELREKDQGGWCRMQSLEGGLDGPSFEKEGNRNARSRNLGDRDRVIELEIGRGSFYLCPLPRTTVYYSV
jgi:hypothetical protein